MSLVNIKNKYLRRTLLVILWLPIILLTLIFSGLGALLKQWGEILLSIKSATIGCWKGR